MIIAIASGKGGTGKTTIATNLALTLAEDGTALQLLDCDVEEPNCHLFLKPAWKDKRPATIVHPQVNTARCTGCGICAEVCEYNAIAVVNGEVLIFPELCHACGACSRFCPEDAITEVPHTIGTISTGHAGNIRFIQGLLNIGELMTPAVIEKVKSSADPDALTIIDAPPGASCPVIEAVRDVDFVLLVTEPTPFGLNDLVIAVEAMRALERPFAVAVNRSDIGNDEVLRYCRDEGIDVIVEIPDDRRIAEAYSRGDMIVHALPHMRNLFEHLWHEIRGRVSNKKEKT